VCAHPVASTDLAQANSPSSFGIQSQSANILDEDGLGLAGLGRPGHAGRCGAVLSPLSKIARPAAASSSRREGISADLQFCHRRDAYGNNKGVPLQSAFRMRRRADTGQCII